MAGKKWLRGLAEARLCVALILVPPVVLAVPPALIVTHRARAIQPGEVVVLTIASRQPLREVAVGAFERSFPCFEDGVPTKWSSLVGIDLDTKPGRYRVAISALGDDGTAQTASYVLAVAAKRFPTRALTVDAKFVSPPPDALTRIQQDSERVRAIFAAVSPERRWAGPFIVPVPGSVISAFGKRSVYNGQPRSPHAGTDFSGAAGTRVKAPNAGKVVLSSDLYYSGNTLILDHGQGLYSWFGHLSAFSVDEGDAVSAGDEIGKVGATGLVTGPHLHWSVRLAGARVDPLSLVDVLTSVK